MVLFISRGLQFINTGFHELTLYPEEDSVANNHFYLESKLRQTPFLAFHNKKLFSICLLVSHKFLIPDTCPVSRTIFDVKLLIIILISFLNSRELKTLFLNSQGTLCLIIYISCKRGSNLCIVGSSRFSSSGNAKHFFPIKTQTNIFRTQDMNFVFFDIPQ